MIIGIWCSFVLKNYLFEPLKLMELANVGCLARHNGFRNMCSIGLYVGLKFKTVIPSLFWGTRLNSFLPELFFSSFISLLAAFDNGVNDSQMTQCHLEFPVELSKDHFFVIVTCYCGWHPIPMKEKRQCLIGFTFQLYWEWAWPTKIGSKNLDAPAASPRHCSGQQCICTHYAVISFNVTDDCLS